ncbi:uncharacterized protein BCR38DRAFT_426345 [Pseudomassariella vexata]|uniref:Protein kinase domain-containing protein n=1 Tax=Pseudomassariella vexata TaxID=1141098 RepID=A0A1Y2E7D8_9PEZI|nr:uncharacterized protein BCR38DRAFT_426345 [Pseudomassariella vexata]ORY67196.1 hypothetical protein BCR38DRAFT_426345 [Pseudomassariella vexata]
MSEHLGEIERLRHELEQAKAREEQLRFQVQETTLGEYLHDCHFHIFKALRIADKSLSSTGHATRVDDKRYPMWLRRWSDFTDLQRDHFDEINRAFGDKRLLTPSIATRHQKKVVCRAPVATEKDIDIFVKVAIESPVCEIFQKLVEADPYICRTFNFTELGFSNNSRELKRQGNVDQTGDSEQGQEIQGRRRRSGPSKRVASEQKFEKPSYPDGLGIRKHLGGDLNLVFVYDYKAAHKLTVEDLKSALIKEKLFMEVVQRVNLDTTRTDPELKGRDKADKQVAIALTQVSDYMVQCGVAYGYITAGKSLVFLHIRQDDLRTLYYHLCVPDEEATGGNRDFKESYTAVAQLASFCLLALRSDALQGPALSKAVEKAKSELQIWPKPYKEAEEYVKAENMDSSSPAPSSQVTAGSLYEDKSNIQLTAREFSLRSRSTCQDATAIQRDDEDDDEDEDDGPSRALPRMPGSTGANKRKEGPSSSSSEDDNQGTSSDSDSPPTRQYCTQACLLGLKRGLDLDENCPNVSLHRTAASSTRHPINASKLTSLVGERLRRNPYRDCVALDPYGLQGKIGAIGALFKVELAQYGYTFVGKGTQSVHFEYLQHESVVYSQLERLQGEVVPVYLGIINLARPWGYVLPGGACVVHMMLMSWAGEVAADVNVPDLATERKRSSRAVWGEGVDHNDEREPNILWNWERQRVMLVDFNLAALRPVVKHKRLSKLSKMGKKRKSEEDILEILGRKRVMMGGDSQQGLGISGRGQE